MASARPEIPSNIATEVLFRADHTCCICRTRGKHVQIHHIDENRRNNNPGNLSVLCLDCHSRVTGRQGFGRAYTPLEVRRYKLSWERQVSASRVARRSIRRYQKELISQIDFMICEILACRPNNPRSIELLELLYELHLWKGNHRIDEKIAEGLNHLALMSGLGSPRLASAVAETLWKMCWHLAGPDRVPMSDRTLDMVLQCLDGLDSLSTFNCEFGHGRKAVENIASYGEEFFALGLSYSRRQIANAVIAVFEDGLKGCYSEGKLEFRIGRTRLRRSVRRIQRLLAKEQPEWAYQRDRLRNLLLV